MSKKLLAIMMTLVMVLALTACGGSGASSSDSEAADTSDIGTVRIGIDGKYMPFQYATDDGGWDGFEIAMTNEISERTGIEVEYIPLAWDGIFGQLDSEKIDTVMCCVFPSEERRQKYDFSREYIYDNNCIITMAGKGKDIQSIEDLEGLKIGVTGGGNTYLRLKEVQDKVDFEIVAYDEDVEIIDMSLGRLDAAYKSPVFAKAMAKEHGIDIDIAEMDPIEQGSCAFPFRRDERSAKIMEAFSGAINDMIEDGTMKELCEQYLELDVTAYEPMVVK